ncbi:hypothetical protein AB0L74_33475 [Streptomyces sp. NPDC052020]|uniref:hypothetical protein n=1 Tax=Streptomyces sp. NPDC052020 TaxID=3155677 RepID=UPI00341796F7
MTSAESGLGAPLPPDLAALLTLCDGTADASAPDRDPGEYDPGRFLAQHHLLPLEAVAAVRGGAGAADAFRGSWVPFAVTDYSLAPWDGLAIEPGGRLAAFSQADGTPPSQPLTAPGYGSLGEFLNASAAAFVQGTGPLTREAVPGLHRGGLVWGPLPGDDAPWTPLHPGGDSAG